MVPANFRSYHLAVQLYRECARLRCARHLREQLLRAASSVALNLAEGSAKPSPADRRRFYAIALGSLREVQAILDLVVAIPSSTASIADQTGACVYRLVRATVPPAEP